jgi:sugar transferase (PEP-CTERM/EpsH1 system associated)
VEPLLFLTHRIPFPPNKGDKVRSFHLLRFLAERYSVHLGTFVDDKADIPHVERVNAFCASAHFASLTPLLARLRSMGGLLSGEPLTIPYYRDRALLRWVADTIKQRAIDRVLVFSSCMAQFLPAQRARCEVVDFVDVDSEKWRQYSSVRKWPLRTVYAREARLLLNWERSVAARATYSVFVSAGEVELFAARAPHLQDRVISVSNGVDTAFFAPEHSFRSPYEKDVRAIVFSGAMDYWPNVDAACWFRREVLPAIVSAVPDVRFYIVGMNPAPAVRALAKEGRVVVTGRVADVRPYLAHAAIVVAPLRVARGVQNKVLEAMAMGRPVIASVASAASLSAIPGTDLETADSAESFANKTIALLGSPRCREMGAAARARVVQDYGWERNLARVAALLEGPSQVTEPGNTVWSMPRHTALV